TRGLSIRAGHGPMALCQVSRISARRRGQSLADLICVPSANISGERNAPKSSRYFSGGRKNSARSAGGGYWFLPWASADSLGDMVPDARTRARMLTLENTRMFFSRLTITDRSSGCCGSVPVFCATSPWANLWPLAQFTIECCSVRQVLAGPLGSGRTKRENGANALRGRRCNRPGLRTPCHWASQPLLGPGRRSEPYEP